MPDSPGIDREARAQMADPHPDGDGRHLPVVVHIHYLANIPRALADGRFNARSEGSFGPASDVDDLIVQKGTQTCRWGSGASEADSLRPLISSFAELKPPDEWNLHPCAVGTGWTAHDFGGSLPELKRVRVRR
jgi:hypothetical protein